MNQYNIERRLLIIQQLLEKVVKPDITCPVCESAIRLYTPFGQPLRRNAMCPVCRALERHRFLWLAIDFLKKRPDTRLLHFAPEKCFHDKLSVMPNIDYFPVDYNPSFPLKLRDVVDIQAIPYEEDFFDLIFAIMYWNISLMIKKPFVKCIGF